MKQGTNLSFDADKLRNLMLPANKVDPFKNEKTMGFIER